jgi:RimJ/RimL family protein N-acetyltransferase
MAPAELTTDRLLLRRWRESDLAPFADLNADPVVMELFPSTLTRGRSDQLVDTIGVMFAERDHGLWAVEERSSGRFAGFVGLAPAVFDAPFTPAVEVGWRLATWCWGNGYATEAARVSIADGFSRLAFGEIVSFTAAVNNRSRRVMEKIGMRRDPSNDFDHPSCLDNDLIRRHVLYRLRRPGAT